MNTKKSTITTISLLFIFTFVFNTMAFAFSADRDIILQNMPSNLRQIMTEHEIEGRTITYYAEENHPQMSRASRTTSLPSSGWSENKTANANSSWAMQSNFYIESSCQLYVHLTTGINGDYVNCDVIVKCVETGATQRKTFVAAPDVTSAYPFNVSVGSTYTVTVVPSETTYLAAYIYGE